MDPELGFKGKACPVINCYMRGVQGECVASQLDDSKPSSKAMRDTILIVEIIEAARNAPAYTKFTQITSVGDVRFDRFIREAEVSRESLQFVLDQHPHWNATLLGVIRASE